MLQDCCDPVHTHTFANSALNKQEEFEPHCPSQLLIQVLAIPATTQARARIRARTLYFNTNLYTHIPMLTCRCTYKFLYYGSSPILFVFFALQYKHTYLHCMLLNGDMVIHVYLHYHIRTSTQSCFYDMDMDLQPVGHTNKSSV